MGISSCVLGEIRGNLFRFPESTRKEGKVFFLFRCFFSAISNQSDSVSKPPTTSCHTLASSLVRQTQLVRLTRVSVSDYPSSVAT